MEERKNTLTPETYRSFRVAIQSAKDDHPKKFADRLLYDWWFVMHSDSAVYSEVFSPLFENRFGLDASFPKGRSLLHAFKEDIKDIFSKPRPNYLKSLIEAKQQFGDVMLLDLMGYGDILRDLGVKGCSLALTDRRSSKDRKADQELGNGFITGDIRSAKSWRALRQWLSTQGEGKQFDIILCRAAGGLLNIPNDRIFYSYCLRNLYEVLINNEGWLLSEFDRDMVGVVQEGSQKLNSISGIESRYFANRNNTIFGLVKHLNAPKSLF